MTMLTHARGPFQRPDLFAGKTRGSHTNCGGSSCGDDQAILYLRAYDPAGRKCPRRNHRAKGDRCLSQFEYSLTLSAGSAYSGRL